MSSIPLNNGEELVLLDPIQTVLNQDLTVIGEALNETMDDIDRLGEKVNAASRAAATTGPWVSTLTFPINNSNGFIPGFAPAITLDFFVSGHLYNIEADAQYFMSTINVTSTDGGTFNIIWSKYGSPSQQVCSVDISRTDVVTLGKREFAMSPMNDSNIHGSVRVGDDFVTAIDRSLTPATYTWSIAETEWSPDAMTVRYSPDIELESILFRSMEEPLGTKNGSNRSFTIPHDEFWQPESLTVYLNGVPYADSEVVSITSTGFSLDASVEEVRLPTALDVFEVSYFVAGGVPSTIIDEVATGSSININDSEFVNIADMGISEGKWLLWGQAKITGTSDACILAISAHSGDIDTDHVDSDNVMYPVGNGADPYSGSVLYRADASGDINYYFKAKNVSGNDSVISAQLNGVRLGSF